MKRHSVFDTLTVWGGFAIFMAAVIYIITKRTSYFIPQFAKDAVAYPFRSRNTTTTMVANHTGSGIKTADIDLATTESALNAKFTEAEHEHEAQMQAIQDRERDRQALDDAQTIEPEVSQLHEDSVNSTSADGQNTPDDSAQPSNITPDDSAQSSNITQTPNEGLSEHAKAGNASASDVDSQDQIVVEPESTNEEQLLVKGGVNETQLQTQQESGTGTNSTLQGNKPKTAALEEAPSKAEPTLNLSINATHADETSAQPNSTQTVQSQQTSAELNANRTASAEGSGSLKNARSESQKQAPSGLSSGSQTDLPQTEVPQDGPIKSEPKSKSAQPVSKASEQAGQNLGVSLTGQSAAPNPTEALGISRPTATSKAAELFPAQQSNDAYPTMYGMAQGQDLGGQRAPANSNGSPQKPAAPVPVPVPAPVPGGHGSLGAQKPTIPQTPSSSSGFQHPNPGEAMPASAAPSQQVPSPVPSPGDQQVILKAPAPETAQSQQSPDFVRSAAVGPQVAPASSPTMAPQTVLAQGFQGQGVKNANQGLAGWEGSSAAAPGKAPQTAQGFVPQGAQYAQQRHAGWARSKEEEGPSDRAPSPTTRQEDTEIGLFRPDEL